MSRPTDLHPWTDPPSDRAQQRSVASSGGQAGEPGGVEDVDGGVQVIYDLIMEVKDAPKPACVAQVVYRYYR